MLIWTCNSSLFDDQILNFYLYLWTFSISVCSYKGGCWCWAWSMIVPAMSRSLTIAHDEDLLPSSIQTRHSFMYCILSTFLYIILYCYWFHPFNKFICKGIRLILLDMFWYCFVLPCCSRGRGRFHNSY